ncbi:hypothetical protein ES703_44724 [subsurface metagenome]
MGKLMKKSLVFFRILWLPIILLCSCDEWAPPAQYAKENAYPDFAYDGQNFFIVWGGDNIYGRILSPEGNYVTPVFQISSRSNIEAEPEIVFLDSLFMIVWEEHLAEDKVRICGVQYNTNYEVMNNSRTELLRGRGLSSPRVEKHTDGFVVVWYEWNAVLYYGYISLFNLNGEELEMKSLGSLQSYISIEPLVRATNADRYFLRRERSAEILNQNLEEVNSIDLPVCEGTSSCYGYDKWINIAEVEAYSYFNNLIITRIAFDGTVIPPDSIIIEREMNYFANPVVCAGDNIFLCIWRQYANENETVNYIRLDSDGNFIDEETVILFENIRPRRARLKYANNKFFLLWESREDDEEGNEEIACCVLSQEGDSLSGRIISISK